MSAGRAKLGKSRSRRGAWSTFRRRWWAEASNALSMKRPVLNAPLDLTAALLFVGMAATGLVLLLVLPPGAGRVWVLWSHERHDWASIHAYMSVALLGVLVAHVALHWKWIVEMVGRRRGSRRVSPRALATAVVAVMVLFFAAFVGAAYSSRKPRASLAECAPPGAGHESGADLSYERDIAPLLELQCVGCHNARQAKAGVRLDGYEAARSLVTPGEASESRLLAVLRGPRDAAHSLDPASFSLLERWICEGAAR